jgi:predicted RNase H-like HicB family nuclease
LDTAEQGEDEDGSAGSASSVILVCERAALGGRLMKFRILVEQDEDGVFVATVPSLPGCVSQGGTREESLRNVREAIEGYLESLRDRGDPIPPSIHEEVIDVAV